MSVLGVEPTYAPGQSCAPQLGLLLLCLVPASTPEAVEMLRSRDSSIAVAQQAWQHVGVQFGGPCGRP